MKKLHIALLLIAAIGIASVVSMYGSTTQYVSFNEAQAIYRDNPSKTVHIFCNLNKSKEIEYDPQKNAEKLVFYAVDSLGVESKVIFNGNIPPQFQQIEKLVLEGHAIENAFFAEKVLTKCPSKYEETQVSEHPTDIPKQ
jgi:cytochrome c-type biogenesis protein CcmE